MYCAWGDITGTIAGSITMTPGVDPDVFTVEVPGRSTVPVNADLTISDSDDADNGTVLTFQDCRAIDGSWSWDPTALNATFQAMDFRWRWRWAEPITGEYNRRDDAGEIVVEKTTAYDMLTLLSENLTIPGSAFIQSTLAARLKEAYPYANWENEPPAVEAEALLARYGGVICPDTEGNIYLWEMNQGRNRPDMTPISKTVGEDVVTAPATIRVQGGRNLYQLELELTAVGYDPQDTTWKTLDATGDDAISYKPDPSVINGWYLGFEEGIADEDAKRAARQTIFRAYRLPDSVTIGDDTLAREEAMRRWEDALVETEIVDEEERNREPYATGAHMLLGTEGDPASEVDDETAFVPVDFRIDTRRGIIIFSQPVFRIDDAELPRGAELTLVCAFRGERYVKDFPLENGIGGLFDIVKNDSIAYRVLADGTSQNENDVNTRASQESDARAAMYDDPVVESSTYVYPGVVNHSPDGAARQITWTIDMGGDFIAEVDRPSADSLPAAQLVVTGPAVIPRYDGSGIETVAVATPATTGALWVTINGDDPAAGDSFGSVADQFYGEKDKTGFRSTGAQGGRACVSPFSSGVPDIQKRIVTSSWTNRNTTNREIKSDWATLEAPSGTPKKLTYDPQNHNFFYSIGGYFLIFNRSGNSTPMSVNTCIDFSNDAQDAGMGFRLSYTSINRLENNYYVYVYPNIFLTEMHPPISTDQPSDLSFINLGINQEFTYSRLRVEFTENADFEISAFSDAQYITGFIERKADLSNAPIE